MTFYKCGHKKEIVITDNNILSVSAYLEWKDTVGFGGSKEKCWECWCKEIHNNELSEKDIKNLHLLLQLGFDSMVGDFSEEEEKEYRQTMKNFDIYIRRRQG